MPVYIKSKLDILLQAINLANYDNESSLDIPMTDLMLMRKEIIELKETVKSQNKKIKELKRDNKNLIGKMINQPRPTTNVSYYIDKIC